MDKDLYEILGVSRTATPNDIKKQFHKLAKQYHPDRNPNDKASETKFKEVNLAYEVLKDKKKKEQYDQLRAAGRNPFAGREPGGGGFEYSAGGASDFGLGDLFEEIFGGGGGGGGFGGPFAGRRRSGGGSYSQMPVRGVSREAEISISFNEAARGGEKQLELVGGKKITVKIPAGVETGSKIKLRGQGDPGTGGAPSGDLILTLKVMAHPQFTRQENNILYQLPVTFAEAVLGGEVAVPTLDGPVRMTLPQGISSGQQLRLKGKGVGEANGTRGDQLVEIQIKVPRPPSDKYKEAAKLLEQEDFNPRR